MYNEERRNRENGWNRNLDGFDRFAGRQEERAENDIHRRQRRPPPLVDEVAGSEFM